MDIESCDDLTRAAAKALAAEPLAGKRVIDFGCGAGSLGVWMAGEGAEVYLVDFDRRIVDEALGEAKARGVERRVRGILFCGERLDMFADRGFDLVFARAVPAPALLAELARALKPDARLVIASAGEVDSHALESWFGAVKIARVADTGGWLAARLAANKRGPAVLTARRRTTSLP